MLLMPVHASLATSRHTVHFEFYPSQSDLIGSKLHLPWTLETGCIPSEPTQCISDINDSLASTLSSDNSPCVSQAPCVSMTLQLCYSACESKLSPSNVHRNLICIANRRSGPLGRSEVRLSFAESKLQAVNTWRNDTKTDISRLFCSLGLPSTNSPTACKEPWRSAASCATATLADHTAD